MVFVICFFWGIHFKRERAKMATRLWTPEDLGIKPLFWFDPEIQKPAFGNVYWDVVSRSDVSTSRGGVTFNYGYFLNNGWACVGKVNETSWPEFYSNSSSSSFNFSVNISSIDFYNRAKYSVYFLSKPHGSYASQSFYFGSINSKWPLTLSRSTSNCYINSYYSDGTSHTIRKNFEGEVNEALVYGFIDFEKGTGGTTYNGNSLELLSDVPSNVKWTQNPSSTTKIPYASFSNSEIAEIIAYYDVLSNENRQKIEGYMMHRWKLSNLLPDNHPYKEAPPVVDIPEPEPEPEGVSFLRIRSDVILDMAVQNRFGDVNIDVGSIPLRMLPLPKDSFTGETVTGHYSVYGNPKYILVPKGQVQMPLSLLFTPNNLKVYSITPCSTTLRFN